MVEDIVIDGKYVESGVQFTTGLIGGSIMGILDEYQDREDSTLSESGGTGVLLTGMLDGAYEVAEYATGVEDDFGAEEYPEYWAGATLGHSGVRKVADMLDGE
jgi:hypothetical protein